jgi:hypothetical protein
MPCNFSRASFFSSSWWTLKKLGIVGVDYGIAAEVEELVGGEIVIPLVGNSMRVVSKVRPVVTVRKNIRPTATSPA